MLTKLILSLFIGAQCSEMINTVSDLRITMFKEYPYLYQGDKEYEKHYVKAYVQERGMVIKAAVKEELAGVITGIPLVEDAETFPEAKQAFVQQGFIPEQFYYIGEVMVMPQFRKKGIAAALFNALEKQAQKWNYEKFCFVTIEHDKNHSLKPANYEDPAAVWRKLGYSKTSVTIPAKYPTICADGSVQEIENTFVFWVKN